MKENLTRSAFKALSIFVSGGIERNLETARIFRAIFSLHHAGLTLFDDSTLFADCQCLKDQLPDGGWSNPEETAWAISVLSQLFEKENEAVRRAKSWLNSVRHPGGGWGRHPRDQVRILTTAIAITLVPSVATDLDRTWVRQAWERDMISPVHLSYKGGFYLLTAHSESGGTTDPLISRTLAYLIDDQNDDGGFAPWKNHPIGSDPWSTGVVLWGLSKWIDRVDPAVIERALHWLEVTQLPSGYWPYHYLDEGTSYALIGAVSAMRAMASRK